MSSIKMYGLLLAINVLAAWQVARTVAEPRSRMAYYCLIWLVPYLGAAIAVFLAKPTTDEEVTDASSQMINEIAKAHKKMHNS